MGRMTTSFEIFRGAVGRPDRAGTIAPDDDDCDEVEWRGGSPVGAETDQPGAERSAAPGGRGFRGALGRPVAAETNSPDDDDCDEVEWRGGSP